MERRQTKLAVSAAMLALATFTASGGSGTRHTRPASTLTARQRGSAETFSAAKLPLRFEANAGQWDPAIRFVAHDHGATVAITDDAMRISVRDAKMPVNQPGTSREEERTAQLSALEHARSATVTMKLAGVRPSAPVGAQELTAKSNFFLGADRTKWRSNVPNYGVVRARDWLPGVDVVWHAGAGGLEYHLDVAAGTDASKLAFDVEGADALRVASDGTLEIGTPAGVVAQKPPRVVQRGKELRTRYVIDGTARVRFDIEGYDRAAPLLIDPTVVFSTYFGGLYDDYAYAVAVDSARNVYVAGWAASIPTTPNAYQATGGGGFVSKFDPTGSTLIYSTYVSDTITALALDSNANAYVTGNISGNYLATTPSAYQPSYGGGMYDAFVVKLNPTGSALVYSTYLGGSDNDFGQGIALDSSGAAYVTGSTAGLFPTTTGAYDSTCGGSGNAFVTKLDPSGSSLLYSTCVPNGVGHGIAIDASGDAYVTGTAEASFPTTVGAFQTTFGGTEDGFVTKLDASGSSLDYSTYLGGSGLDYAYGIALDSTGDAFVTGETQSPPDFPTTLGAYQTTPAGPNAFITKLNASGSALVYSTAFGGNNYSSGSAIAVDPSGNAYIAGGTFGALPTTSDAYQPNFGGGQGDAFFATFDATGSALTYSTYLGGAGPDAAAGIALDSLQNAYVVGNAQNFFPTTINAFQRTCGGWDDAFVVQFSSLTITPATATVPAGGSASFSASGGSGAYSFSIAMNASGGSINSATGAYTAGPKAGVYDLVEVTDSAGRVAPAKVTIPELFVECWDCALPAPPRSTLDFTATGGSGTGYSWSLTTNNSGGTIDSSTGVYTAGATPSVTDVITLTDSLGNVATQTVPVGPGIMFNPATPTTPPNGTIAFAVYGGYNQGGGYSLTLTTNNSGGHVSTTGDYYTAGSLGGTFDVVTATDALGNTGSVTIQVGPTVTITPPSPAVPPKGSIAFGASGGSGTGYVWTLSTNASGGSINWSTGAYVAGPKGGVKDVVAVNDSLGNIASATIDVGPDVAIAPAAPATPPKGSISFSATGGSGAGLDWSISSNKSGATIDATSGSYKAGATGNVADTVAVSDSLGNKASVNVSVGGGLAINPASAATPPKGSLAFTVIGGSGDGYVWSLQTNESGATIDSASGKYVAGPTGNATDVVQVTDSLSNTTSVSVTVGVALTIAPAFTTVAPGGQVLLSGAGGSGNGFAWSLHQNASGGSVGSVGNYTAGPTQGVDIVELVDSLGSSATATIIVGDGHPGDAGALDGGAIPSVEGGGCSCNTTGHSSSPSPVGAISVLAALALTRRRRTPHARGCRSRRVRDRTKTASGQC